MFKSGDFVEARKAYVGNGKLAYDGHEGSYTVVHNYATGEVLLLDGFVKIFENNKGDRGFSYDIALHQDRLRLIDEDELAPEFQSK